MKTTLDFLLLLTLMGVMSKVENTYGVKISYYLYPLFIVVYFKDFIFGIKKIFHDRTLFFILIPIALSFLSMFWSEYKLGVLLSSVEVILVSYFSICFLSRDESDFYNKLFISIFIVASVSIILYLVFPGSVMHKGGPDDGVALSGIFEHKNTLGRTVGFGMIILIYSILFINSRPKILYLLMLVLLFVVLLMSRSGTSIVGVFLYLIIAYASSRKLLDMVFLKWFLYLIPLIPVFMINSEFILNNILFLLDRDVDSTTFGVREHLWHTLFDSFKANVLFGFGANSFWSEYGFELSVFESSSLIWSAKQAHNGYLDLMLSFGVLGFAYAIKFVYEFINILVSEKDYLAYGLLFYFLILNNMYSLMFGQVAFTWFLMITIFSFLRVRGKCEEN